MVAVHGLNGASACPAAGRAEQRRAIESLREHPDAYHRETSETRPTREARDAHGVIRHCSGRRGRA